VVDDDAPNRCMLDGFVHQMWGEACRGACARVILDSQSSLDDPLLSILTVVLILEIKERDERLADCLSQKSRTSDPRLANQSFGLTHSRRPQEWPRLLGAAEAWAVARGCTEARAVVARDDAAKLRRFEDLGLARTGEVAEGAFELGAVVLGGVVLQKALMPRTASL
jgi:hypothetical protein